MKVALVGIGKIARDQHAPAIAADPNWELAATVSRSGRLPDVEAYTDIGAFLAARPDVPVVSLCLPPVPRFAAAEAALSAGRHVMLEKPPGATLSECRKLADLAQASGVTLFATWHSRAAAMVEPARAWLADKALRSVVVTWKEDVRRWHPGQDWIWEPGGLGVFDPGINALSILTRILPGKAHLTEATLEVPENKQAPIAAQLRFHHPSNAPVTADFDWRQEGDQIWRIDVETEQGTLCLDGGGASLLIDGEPQTGGRDALDDEYPTLYAQMTQLIASRSSDTDFEPFRHVADAFLLGRRQPVAPFFE
ncbi:MAG: Gfo/Idh/MocA family oxidoreductase [Devosiaceae bacterium]|nr:Gfo/Idh/MocA family oxidoreductase [Devosiaceae bacterium MH13]